ncbi:MAG: ATP-binding protein [Candidatus Brocadiales bacterium]|nr:ATP-binding protein [Candidatus Brocadiales bacterium]
MDETIKQQLQYLGLEHLWKEWDSVLKTAKKKQPTYQKFLTDILEKEYFDKTEKARLSRIKRAKIHEYFVMKTFPFARQPKLKKRVVMELYESLRFITQKQDLVFIGPTGCGKTGLATSFLVHAINQGYRGLSIGFTNLLDQLRTAKGEYTLNKLLKKLQSYEILLIDEFGYDVIDKETAGPFFELLRKRNNHTTTIITTQLGFEEWNSFFKDKHLTAALLDRITVNCTIFNMKNCISIRAKNIVYATKK